MTVSALSLDRAAYRPHALHQGDARVWGETNCYVDLWIEVVHALGHDPHALLGCALASDFSHDQWLFFKPSASDLYAFYGLDVQELTIYRPLLAHARTHLAAGRLLLVEVDAYHLPDTRGVSYRQKHTKTTVALDTLDTDARSLRYFHNAGYYELSGEDFDALFAPIDAAAGGLVPYTEYVRVGMPAPLPDAELAARARASLAAHLARAPVENPFARYRACFRDDLAALTQEPAEAFHEYAFATIRQFGAAFELAGAYLGWLGARGLDGVDDARAGCELIASHAKTLQFKAARAVMLKRAAEFDGLFDEMERAWTAVYDGLRRVHR